MIQLHGQTMQIYFSLKVVGILSCYFCFAIAPAGALRAEETPRPRPIEPPEPAEIEAAIRRGVDFLIERQNPDGSWGSARRTKDLNIYAPVPGAHQAFRAAVTAMCVEALLEVADPRPVAQEAIDRGEKWLLKNLPRVRRATPAAIYNVWTHAYAIQALARLHDRHEGKPDQQKTIVRLLTDQFEFLQRYESVNGGWGYYDFHAQLKKPSSLPNSFTTATVLIAADRARPLGVKFPEKIEQRAIAVIHRQQKPDFTYLYGEWHRHGAEMKGINRPAGSLGRSQACNAALRIHGDEAITDDVLIAWLDRLFARNGWLSIGRKRPVPHEAWFAVAGYFYYYGHYYAALCIEMLPLESRPRYQAYLASTLIEHQEKDGSWWDFPLYDYHQPYGTAFALMSLVRCRPQIDSTSPAETDSP